MITSPLPQSRPIVLIRGLMREQRHWGSFKHLLAEAFAPRSVICCDLPGNGRWYRLPSVTCIGDARQSLRIQLRWQSVDIAKVDVVALSLGAMIALDWQQHFAHELNSICLINASNAAFSPFYQRLRWQNYHRIAQLLFSPTAQREPRLLALTSNHAEQHTAIVKCWQRYAQQCPVSRVNALRQLYAASRFRHASAPKVPCLLLSAKQDRLVSANCSHAMAKCWQLEHEQHPSGGHDLPLDEPQWLIQRLRQWWG